MADVFISYAREDQPFAKELARALGDRGKEVWGDWDMSPGTDWRDEARAGIEASDSIVFVITRHSIESENCLYELGHAQRHSKRIITLRKDALEAEELPPTLAPITWIDFADGTDVAAGWVRVVAAVEQDLDWVHGHTRWLRDAIEWDDEDREPSFLISGAELSAAESWLTQAQAQEKQPPASPLHYEFILASRRATTSKQRRQFMAVTGALAVALVLGANWFFERNEAREQRRVAISRLLANVAVGQMERRLDTGLLIGVAAYEAEPTPEARDSVLTGLRRSEHVLAFLRGEGGAVSAVSFDPSSGGEVLAGAASDGRVWLWSARSRRANPVGGHLRPVSGVAFSADGRLLASVDDGGKTLVRPVASRDETVEPLPDALVTALAFAPRSDTLALGTATGAVALWHPERGTLFRSKVDGAPITALSFDKAGTTLVAGSQRGLVALRLRDGLPRGRRVKFGRGSAVADIAFGGGRLAVVRGDGRVVEWTLGPIRAAGRPLDAPEDFESVAVGPAGDLATGAADGSVTLWDPGWEEQLGRLRGHGAVVTDLAFDGDGRRLASASTDETIVVWDLESTPLHDSIAIAAGDPRLDELFDLAFGHEGGSIVASALDEEGSGRVVRADVAKGTRQDLGPSPGSRVDLDVTPDGAWLAAAGQRGLAVWRLGEPPQRALPHGEAAKPATAVAFSGDGKELALGLQDGSIRLWDVPLGQAPRLLGDQQETVRALAFAPDRPLLASGGESGALTIWNVVDKRSAKLPERLADRVRGVDFSPEEGLVAYGGGDAVVVWDVESWSLYARLTLRGTAVTDVAFSPGTGRWLAISDTGGRIVFWDVAERRPVGDPLEAAEDEIVALDFRPGGSALAAAVGNGAVLLWDDVVWTADEARRRICELVARRLADDERSDFIPRGTDVDPCARPG